jgi:hypothetical protein
LKPLAGHGFWQYDFTVELGIIIAIVALWLLGSMIPTGHSVPQEIASLQRRQRFSLPYTNEIKAFYRIWATWRVEPVTPSADALTQHFEVLRDAAPYYQTRKMF